MNDLRRLSPQNRPTMELALGIPNPFAKVVKALKYMRYPWLFRLRTMPGYLTHLEGICLHKLAKKVPNHSRIIEIGSYKGKSTLYLATALKRKKNVMLFCIDTWNSIVNGVLEDTLEEKLMTLGFKIIYCENISFEEQISLFSMARLIVAPHGAGLSNMVWADSPCKVVEIFPSNIFNDCYARLALTLGSEYDYVVSSIDTSSDGKIPVDIVLKKIARYT